MNLVSSHDPTTSLSFLGVVLDTARREIQIPEEKLQRIHQEVTNWLEKKRMPLSDLGKPTAAYHKGCKTRKIRMYAIAQRVKEMDFYTRISEEFHSDLTG